MIKLLRAAFVAAFFMCAALPPPALAQQLGAFAPSGQATLSATTTSARIALPTGDPTALIQNTGAVTVYLAFGGATVDATVSGIPLQAGQSIAFSPGVRTHVAAIAASGSASLSVTTGTGVPALANAGGSGGGSGGGTATLDPFAPTGNAALSASAASARVALASADDTAVVFNLGSAIAYVEFGGSGVIATTSSTPVPPGMAIAFDANANTHVAAITDGATTALRVTTGAGAPAFGLALDNSTAVPVSDNGGSLTIDGVIALSAGAANIGDVDVLTLPSLPAGSNAIGGVTQSGAWNVSGTGSLASPAAGLVSVQGTIADTVSAGGVTNPVAVGGIYNSALPNYSSGARTQLQAGIRGGLITNLCSDADNACVRVFAASGDDLNTSRAGLHTFSEGYIFDGTNPDRIRSIGGSFGSAVGVVAVEQAGALAGRQTANATTTHKSGPGILHKVCVNTKGASANTATIYDNTAGSGTTLAVIDTTERVGCLAYDVGFATGLTVVTATGTAGDLTVVYR